MWVDVGLAGPTILKDEVLKRQVKTLYVCKRTHCPTPTVLIFTHCGVIIIVFFSELTSEILLFKETWLT